MMTKTIEELHIAAQYLAAVNISFIERELDDSHTNLGWDKYNRRLTTHMFGSKRNQLGLKFDTGHMEWMEDGTIVAVHDLQHFTHAENLNWIEMQVKHSNVSTPFKYEFHYELPYDPINENHVFKFNSDATKDIIERLNTAQDVFENLLKKNGFRSAVRIWPHHFDLGLYTQMDAFKGLFLGAGLAIPDTLESDMYFYASGWRGGKSIPTGDLGMLTYGQWRKDWDGATLNSTDISTQEAGLFYKEAVTKFQEIG